MDKKRALIAMSGGVDSSVAAVMMMKQGYECIGITMHLYGQEDTEDAARVCKKLGIEFIVDDYRKEFSDCVISSFLSNYKEGKTPNPCIECNRNLKFGRLYLRAMELGCDVIVTGHYAQIRYNDNTGLYELHKGASEHKDQSYVLFMLSQEQLSHVRLPIGALDKEETRKIATEHQLFNAHKHDSQDICFIPDGDYHGFLQRNGIVCEPGSFVKEDGTVLGTHTGICNYTIGQRKGLGISAQTPLYVKEISSERNEVVLSDNEALYQKDLEASHVSWTGPAPCEIGDSLRCAARIRYHHTEAPAVVTLLENNRIHVCFDSPQRAITPGQAVVCYDGTRVLGGGIIC